MSSWLPTTEADEFESRKRDHIRLALDKRNEAVGGSGMDRVELIHEALPDFDFSEISTDSLVLGRSVKVPFVISSMTAGHREGVDLNRRLAKTCGSRGWWMGVGSQRRELFDEQAANEWRSVRDGAPGVQLLGNIGITQAIRTPLDRVQRLVDSLEAVAMIVHTNPLQESLQPEGTPQFRGSLETLKRLAEGLPVPVILKETGCGISAATLNRLRETGIAAVDVSGFGGTHWGRIEGERAGAGDLRNQAAQAFSDWGISTAHALESSASLKLNYEIWASGGIRSGVDAAKALAMGARMVGIAKPALEAALKGERELEMLMERYEFELKTAMFCTGVRRVSELSQMKVWQWRKT